MNEISRIKALANYSKLFHNDLEHGNSWRRPMQPSLDIYSAREISSLDLTLSLFSMTGPTRSLGP
jgi:hypothetical protein